MAPYITCRETVLCWIRDVFFTQPLPSVRRCKTHINSSFFGTILKKGSDAIRVMCDGRTAGLVLSRNAAFSPDVSLPIKSSIRALVGRLALQNRIADCGGCAQPIGGAGVGAGPMAVPEMKPLDGFFCIGPACVIASQGLRGQHTNRNHCHTG